MAPEITLEDLKTRTIYDVFEIKYNVKLIVTIQPLELYQNNSNNSSKLPSFEGLKKILMK